MKSRLSDRNFEQHWAADLDDLDREIIRQPILAERLEEIPSLVERILERANCEEGWQIKGVSLDVLDLFHRYTWYGSGGTTPELVGDYLSPGWTGSGVELQNVLYRAAEPCRGPIIQLDDLPPYIHAKVNGEQELQ
jgi:DNA-binding NtrC family response regulator